MIAILKQSASDEAVSHIVSWIEKKGLKTDVSRGENETIIGLVGCYQGFQVKGGAEGVGRVTTQAVVSCILLIVAADAVLNYFLLFQ